MGEKRGVYRVLVGKPEGKGPLGRPRRRWEDNIKMDINPLNAELNPICHLLTLLGAHHIFHVSGLRVNERQVNKIVRQFTQRTKHVRDNMSVNSYQNKKEASGKGSRENKNTHCGWSTFSSKTLQQAVKDECYGAEKIRFACRLTGAKIHSVLIFYT